MALLGWPSQLRLCSSGCFPGLGEGAWMRCGDLIPTPPPPGEALPLLCLAGRRNAPLSPCCSQKGDHHFCLLYFCECFSAPLGAGLRPPMYFSQPLNNYQLVKARSWTAKAIFILLAGGKELCLPLPASVQYTGWLLCKQPEQCLAASPALQRQLLLILLSSMSYAHHCCNTMRKTFKRRFEGYCDIDVKLQLSI